MSKPRATSIYVPLPELVLEALSKAAGDADRPLKAQISRYVVSALRAEGYLLSEAGDPATNRRAVPDMTSAETRLLAAFDGLRDAMAEFIAEGRPEPVPDRELLTLAAAARKLGIARSTANRWAGSGAIATVELDGRRWVSALELDRVAGVPVRDQHAQG